MSSELKDNSFNLLAKVKKVGFDDKGAQVTLTIDEEDYLDVVNQLVMTSGTNVMVKITPNQTELNTDSISIHALIKDATENQQGNKVYVTEVVVENFSLLEPKSHSDQSPQDSKKKTPPANQDPFASNGKQIDIDEDDLTF